MSAQTATPCTQKLDPLKRVNYTYGMVLGVDEFKQEQTYFLAKNRAHNRLAHGYGTICGLHVQIVTAPDLEVQVTCGSAINPQGQEIHVQQLMCSRINDWLNANKTALQAVFGIPPFELPVCVVLCYRECPTDVVPVPGEPCRTQQDAMAPSHIAESFQLKLCIDSDKLSSPPISPPSSPPSAPLPGDLCYSPSQVEEDAIRAFGTLLRRIQITDIGPSSVTQAQLEDLVRELSPATASSVLSSPPLGTSPIQLHVADASEFLRAAFLVWVTEVRPTLTSTSTSCGCCIPSEQCVLLAELSFTVGVSADGWQVIGGVTVDEGRRPYLLETRLLQEYLLGGNSGAAGSGGGVHAGIAVVAAGTFSIQLSGTAVANDPTFNNLTATFVAAGQYLLNWTGFPSYQKPVSSPPSSNTYVVKGSVIAGAKTDPFVLQFMSFENTGIMVRVLNAQTADPPLGFMVEISEITSV
jgi:hypothetical protein